MPACPHCGTHVGDDSTTCPGCGQPVTDHPARDPYRTQSRRDGPRNEPRKEGGDRNHRADQRRRDGQPHRDRTGGTDRRGLLKVGGVIAVLGAGGFLAFDAQSGTGPTGTARSFVEALDAGDVERANELVHDQAPLGELEAVDFVSIATTEYVIDSTEVVERTDDDAIVTVTLSRGSSETARTEVRQVELRRQDGEWRVWQYE